MISLYDERPQVYTDEENTFFYDSGSSLSIEQIDEGWTFTYVEEGRESFTLNELLTEEWVFIPVTGKFCIRYAENRSPLCVPEIHLSVPACSSIVQGLAVDETAIFAALHEVGDAHLYERIYNFAQQPYDVRKKQVSQFPFVDEKQHSFVKLCQVRDGNASFAVALHQVLEDVFSYIVKENNIRTFLP